MSITDHPAYKRAYTEMQSEIANKIEPISEVMHRWEAERALIRRDPHLAALLRIEAIADDRAENHQCAASKLVVIRDLARRVVADAHGKFKNPLFPFGCAEPGSGVVD